ncbi:acyl-CoA dehydrogenase family protein [Corallococcus exiguus]|uniref:acyl-CoA dehydrogenase family protein n=1 Tax=Corallococcus exiguus TaxID=83462 RepID=UPI001F5F891D|nr:acyl-CoA dehydrogenase family protein [Corallococcus exiguus]
MRATRKQILHFQDTLLPDFPVLQMQAKVVANETAVAITTAAIEFAIGSGYRRSHPIKRYLRDAMSGQLMA